MSSGLTVVTPSVISLTSSWRGGWLCLRWVLYVTLDALRLFSLLLNGFILPSNDQIDRIHLNGNPAVVLQHRLNHYINHIIIINQICFVQLKIQCYDF
jgi:hypothetical protein